MQEPAEHGSHLDGDGVIQLGLHDSPGRINNHIPFVGNGLRVANISSKKIVAKFDIGTVGQIPTILRDLWPTRILRSTGLGEQPKVEVALSLWYGVASYYFLLGALFLPTLTTPITLIPREPIPEPKSLASSISSLRMVWGPAEQRWSHRIASVSRVAIPETHIKKLRRLAALDHGNIWSSPGPRAPRRLKQGPGKKWALRPYDHPSQYSCYTNREFISPNGI